MATPTRSIIFFALLSLFGCSSASPHAWDESVGQTTSPVIGGTPSDASQNSVVLVARPDQTNNQLYKCSGTLLAPKLVLTARHCIADTDLSVACDVEGNPIEGGAIREDFAPDAFYIFTGQNAPDFSGDSGTVYYAARGKQVLDNGATNLCNNDIALIVLDTAITNMPISPVRLDSDVQVGELVTAVGWGVTEAVASPAVRQQRTGVEVLAVGTTGGKMISPNEFGVGESICQGDSGGPAFASTGAAVGVTSRGGNGQQPDSADPAATCINAKNIYTKLSPFKDLLLQGYAAAGAEPWLEGDPDPRLAKVGTPCTTASECQSNLCLADPSNPSGSLACVANCSSSACPDGQVCNAEGDARVCRNAAPAASKTSGCSAAPTEQSGSGVVGAAIVALGLTVARRRRAARG